jgi:hypothetical protein
MCGILREKVNNRGVGKRLSNALRKYFNSL